MIPTEKTSLKQDFGELQIIPSLTFKYSLINFQKASNVYSNLCIEASLTIIENGCLNISLNVSIALVASLNLISNLSRPQPPLRIIV